MVCPFCRTENRARKNVEHIACFKCLNSFSVLNDNKSVGSTIFQPTVPYNRRSYEVPPFQNQGNSPFFSQQPFLDPYAQQLRELEMKQAKILKQAKKEARMEFLRQQFMYGDQVGNYQKTKMMPYRQAVRNLLDASNGTEEVMADRYRIPNRNKEKPQLVKEEYQFYGRPIEYFESSRERDNIKSIRTDGKSATPDYKLESN